jgi:hypothetical protein
MIKYVVMWTVAGENRAEKIENATKVKVAYEGLRGRIPGLNHIEVGMDFIGIISTRSSSKTSATVSPLYCGCTSSIQSDRQR